MRGMAKGKKAGTLLLLTAAEIRPNPQQPRQQFGADELQSLAQSIRENGILQPLTVRNTQDGHYELIAGERRLRAAQLAGLRQLPCIVTEADDAHSAVLALVENLQRQDLSFFEEAEAVARLMRQHNLSQEQLARVLGRAASTLSNKLRLLKLPGALRQQIEAAGLTERHARALLRLEKADMQAQALQTILAQELNVQQTDRLIDELNDPAQRQSKKTGRPTIRLVGDVRLFTNTIRHAVDVMRRAGIPALSETAENDAYLIYTVRIPKQSAVSKSA